MRDHEIHMHGKYQVSISNGSGDMANVKLSDKQKHKHTTHKQTVYLCKLASSGHHIQNKQSQKQLPDEKPVKNISQ